MALDSVCIQFLSVGEDLCFLSFKVLLQQLMACCANLVFSRPVMLLTMHACLNMSISAVVQLNQAKIAHVSINVSRKKMVHCRLKTQELKNIRRLAQEVLLQRSDVETFLVSSLKEVCTLCTLCPEVIV